MKKRLTDKTVTHLAPPSAGRVDVFDTLLPGFGVRVNTKGRKTFFVFYRVNGRQSRLLLGDYSETEGQGVKLAEARAAARAAMTKVAEGDDPRQSPSETIPDGARESFEGVVADYVTYHCKVKLKPRTAASYERELNRIKAKLGSKPITKLTRRHVLDITEDHLRSGHPAQAVLTHRILAAFFNWTVQRGILPASPIAGLKLPAKIPSRDRVLTDGELAAVWEAAGELGYPFGPFVRLLAATGQRESETAHMRHEDLDGALWSIPDPKNSTPHMVTLPAMARAELDALPRFKGPFVFSGRAGKTPVSGFSRAKRALDERLKEMHQSDAARWPEVAPWRFHDLRRTVASRLAEMGTPPHIIEALLNHRSGQVSGVARVYNRYRYVKEIAEALRQWNAQLERITGAPRPAEIVELRHG